MVSFTTSIELSEHFIKLLQTDGLFFTSKKMKGIHVEYASSTNGSCPNTDTDSFLSIVSNPDDEAENRPIGAHLNLDYQLPKNLQHYMKSDYIIEEGSSSELHSSAPIRNKFSQVESETIKKEADNAV